MRIMLKIHGQRRNQLSSPLARQSLSPIASPIIRSSSGPILDLNLSELSSSNNNVHVRVRHFGRRDIPLRTCPQILGEPAAPISARASAAMSQGDGAKDRDASPGSGDESGELGDVKDKPREKSKVKGKIVRVLTVLAYVLSVSLAAIMLSLYYMFVWDPKMPGSGSMGRLQVEGPDAEPSYAMHSSPADPSASPAAMSAVATALAGTAPPSTAHAVNATDYDAGVTQMITRTGV